MNQAVLCFLKDDKGRKLFLRKERNGSGVYNGIWTPIKNGEDKKYLAAESIYREFKIIIPEKKWQKIAEIGFYYGRRLYANCHIFMAGIEKDDKSSIRGGEWFLEGELPFDEMRDGDHFWLPLALQGERKINARVVYDSKGKKVKVFQIKMK